ncbi:MAG: hypothetical protein EOP61_12665, partial [Sphingomonadales bacterium]
MTQDRLIGLATMAALLALPATSVAASHGVTQTATQRAVRAPAAKVSDYSWIDRADALWEAIGDAPPDFSFRFEGLEPWAWQTADGHQIMVEDAGARGGIRSYYFAPGAQNPFLVVEPGASFGFTGAKLAVVYGPDGGVVPRAKWGKRPARGQLLFARARLIKRAMERERYGIDPYVWIETSGPILTFLGQWDLGHTRYPGWRTHRNGPEGMDRRRRLENERARRRGEANDFDRWRRGDFREAPPAGAGPRRPGPSGYRPQPGRPNAGGAMPARPWNERPRPRPEDRDPAFDPALIEPMVPGTRPPGGERPSGSLRPARNDRQPAPPAADSRPSRPQRPAPGAQLPVQPQPLPPSTDRPARPQRPAPGVQASDPAPKPAPPERADPSAPAPSRPDRGDGRPPRVEPVAPAPQPIEMRPEPMPPAPQPVEV